MKRKEFLTFLGGISAAGSLPVFTSAANPIGSPAGIPVAGSDRLAGPGPHDRVADGLPFPLDTPDKRMEYARRLLHLLCDEIGPRPTGTPAYLKGARILHQEMERTLPEVSYDRYTFERWELIEPAEFWIGNQYIEIWPAHGSEGTPPDGVEGTLQRRDGQFVFVDSLGEERGRFRVNSYGRAIPFNQARTQPPSVPFFGVGKQDLPILEKAVREGSRCRIRAWVRLVSGDPGINVVGRLPGRSRDEILFIAHADTVYNSPGANDNTASVIIMILLAHAAALRDHRHTLTFVASDAEEYGKLGAHHYAEQRLADGSMKNIRYVVNLDSLTYGPNLWVNSHNEDLKEMIRAIHRDLNLQSTPRYDDRDGFVMDSEPFRPSGARAMHLNSRGYDEKTLPLYHRPDDFGRDVPLDCVESSFQILDEFIRRADRT